MGVASIPEHKDQLREDRQCDEWSTVAPLTGKMEPGKSRTDEYVTVVSVGGNQPSAENFVTVLSIGKRDEETAGTKQNGCIDGHLEEEVEVYRLPGERLGFGLKFEGGNKTSERVRRLFVQSCAEQSPASRAKCSWGALGEGDEVLSIDGVPVCQMTRLDCVRRLKESQLVIRLTVRCRGALRPEVVSAERKSPAEKTKIPPELPSVPPPVPPRKLRQFRSPADGEANPCPTSRTWDRANPTTSGKPGPYENCEPQIKNINARNLPKERSPEMQKAKQEPPEAMVYLDARSQCGSTHGSTSDDTGSSMSTVVDKFSTSDRVSTISTVSTNSTTSEQLSLDCDEENDRREAALSHALCPFDRLDKEFQMSPPDYLLRRLASSEAVTHVEPRGEVERITAVVAPNTVLIEETITLQPPLSFQDAPLSYGHEARPDLFYAPDLAADSTTHFRPIKDDAALVERVNGEHDDFRSTENCPGNSPPPLPARNHVNRINVNQQQEIGGQFCQQVATKDLGEQSLNGQQNPPVLPPKPLPRKDVRRKKLPPPPPPPITPRREVRPTPAVDNSQINLTKETDRSPEKKTIETENVVESSVNNSESEESFDQISLSSSPEKRTEYKNLEESCRQSSASSLGSETSSSESREDSSEDCISQDNKMRTNKVLEIIEIRKAKALSPHTEVSREKCKETVEKVTFSPQENETTKTFREDKKTKGADAKGVKRYEKASLMCLKNSQTISTECEVTDTNNSSESSNEATILPHRKICANSEEDTSSFKEAVCRNSSSDENVRHDSDEDETYKSLDEIKDDLKSPDTSGSSEDDEIESDSTDDSDDGRCCWQSNLATIGEEEETNSLECINTCNDGDDSPIKNIVKPDPPTPPTSEKDTCDKNGSVNDRMDNCGGGQRLPPDGDEFPAAYQEFTSDQQYQYSTSARTSTMTSNSNEITSYPSNDLISTKTILVNVEDVEENDVSSDEVTNENKSNPYKVTENSGKRNNSASNVTHYPPYQASNSNVTVFEKKIETVRYYQKENIGQFHKEFTADTETVNRLNKDAIPSEAPPPLPLTGPPKIESIGDGHTKNVPPVFGQQQQRKFSLNGEHRRQDDRSEKSVKDKIAMFSTKNSLEAPLFPTTTTITSVGRRLSKYRSTDDVCSEDKNPGQRDRQSFFADRTRSSFDLTDSSKPSVSQEHGRKISNFSQPSARFSYCNSVSGPNVFEKSQSTPASTAPSAINSPIKTNPLSNLLEAKPLSPSLNSASYASTISPYALGDQQNGESSLKSGKGPLLTRATSFSGSSVSIQDRSSGSNDGSSNLLISRTNSMASTMRPKVNEDSRKSSLNQLIEQRRKSISKLRGLVIPEKDAVSVDQPIIDLPEIKSRDSILLRQIPKANIQDKWGSQSSIASNASTASVPLKPTTSFKMPAPQIHSKYSPAFKRKSLAVYSTGSFTPISKGTGATTTPISEPPKSLESISSPTRNDYSFEYASVNSSPEVLRTRPKVAQKKTRPDYDDSDNDSAVSSSQSSISRGCSPTMSPVPSERSTVSSERSYVSTEMNYQRGSLIMVSPNRNFRDTVEKERFSYGPSNLVYLSSEGSSSSGGSSHSRSPQPIDVTPKTSQIPQRLALKRSNSSDTNCSTSSTLTSGSQASTESLSRRVLKPQSVEAINRKNILASARCRSGRDLNGSPLIQRKFATSEDTSLGQKIETRNNRVSGSSSIEQTVKIAYLEETDSFPEEREPYEKPADQPKSPPKRSITVPTSKPTKPEVMEPSNDLRMWVQSEAKSLMRTMKEQPVDATKKSVMSRENDRFVKSQNKVVDEDIKRSDKTLDSEGQNAVSAMTKTNFVKVDNKNGTFESMEEKSKSTTVLETTPEEHDLLTVLTTRSRSRSTIHLDGNIFSRSRSQDLDDILNGKIESVAVAKADGKMESNGVQSQTAKKIGAIESRREKKSSLNESCEEEKVFISKIPTLGKSRVSGNNERITDSSEKSRIASTKIPTTRSLGRRSASVTDMKKALEKVDSPSSNTSGNQQHSIRGTHNRFSSLDSSMEESSSAMGSESETDRYCGEQFGSISSLASSTSLISQQELAQLVEEASLEEPRNAHDVIVVPLHKEIPTGSVGITLAGGVECEVKEITVYRVLPHSIADRDGRIQRGDRILSINGRSTRGMSHRESLAVLKQPRTEIVLVVSRARADDDYRLKSRTDSVETIVEALETNGSIAHTAWGPPTTVAVYKDGAGLGFSLEGGRDSPLGDRPLLIKKIFTGGAAEKTGLLKAGDQLLEVNGNDVTRMSRIEAWSLMKKLHVGEVNLLVRHPATKST